MKSKVDTLKELYDQGMFPFLQRLWHMAIDPLNPKIASYFSLTSVIPNKTSYENKGNDHQLKKSFMVKQILMNFVMGIAHHRVSVAQWQSIGTGNPRRPEV